MSSELTLADIADAREYEGRRNDARARIIALKRIRRVKLGPILSLVFENRETVWFQIQEMVRAERMQTDAQVQGEIDTYNPLVPRDRELSASLFIELSGEPALRTWLPKLTGIERAIELRIGAGAESVRLPARVDEQHAAALTRAETTSAVHFIRFTVPADLRERLLNGPVMVASIHESYQHEEMLSDETRRSLFGDLSTG